MFNKFYLYQKFGKAFARCILMFFRLLHCLVGNLLNETYSFAHLFVSFSVIMLSILRVGLLVLFLGECAAEYTDWDFDYSCPGLLPKVFTSSTPKGNLTYAVYTEQPQLNGMRQCMIACCGAPLCNVAMVYNSTCFHVRCSSSKMCAPLYRPDLDTADPPKMVLVKPTVDEELWTALLDQLSDGTG